MMKYTLLLPPGFTISSVNVTVTPAVILLGVFASTWAMESHVLFVIIISVGIGIAHLLQRSGLFVCFVDGLRIGTRTRAVRAPGANWPGEGTGWSRLIIANHPT